ncbi:MAG TPA: FtsX-like permease family protein [Anaerolineales bacterium]|nr:FtsX-like permease family protein [Anaerolineales bacterium]
MTISKLWTIAYRDLGRNKRRTIISLTAVALGLALLILMSGFIAGVMDGSLQNSIRLNTGHVQVRAESYEEAKLSLLWSDLIQNPTALIDQTQNIPEIKAATPVLWSGGVLSTMQESVSVKINGVDTQSSIYGFLDEGLIEGQTPSPEARGEILIGLRLASNMGIGVGSRISLFVGQSEGDPREGIFTVSGIYSTGIPTYDESTIFMPLSQAQAFTGAGERASAIIVMLNNSADAEKVAGLLKGPGIKTLTWEEMHAYLLVTIQSGMSFYYMMYGIVMLVVAVIIANTLLMAVFERIREMGILSALGMKSRQILAMMLLEATALALAGILIGILLGSALVKIFESTGIAIGESAASVAGGVALSSTVYTKLMLADVIGLSLAMFIIILLASFYPARFASRLEPVAALHAQ